MPVLLQPGEKKITHSKKDDLVAGHFHDYESLLASFFLTLLIHLLAYFTIPKAITAVPGPERERVNEVEYVYQDIEEEPKPETQLFVEANPDVPTNLPDTTLNIAARDQQAAQEEPTEIVINDTPFLEGEEALSPKILAGMFPSQSQPVIEASQQPMRVQGAEQSSIPLIEEGVVFASPEPPPRPDFIDQEPDAEEGMASLLEPGEGEDPAEQPADRVPLAINLNPDSIEGSIARNQNSQTQAADAQSQTQPQLPKPRPRLSADILPGPMMKSTSSVPGLGMIAIEAKFSEFGDYLQRMYEAIGYQWLLLANQTRRASAQIASRVVIEFIIFNEGDIENLRVVHSTAGQAATIICKDAVQSRSPFGVWTDEMVRTLGEEQTIRVTFIYR
jgi:hypothetical protein